jgi:hypothetical protein
MIALDATGWLSAAYPGSGSGNTATVSYSVSANASCIVVLNGGAGNPIASQPSYSVSDGTSYTAIENIARSDGANGWAMLGVHILLNANSGTHSVVGTNSAGSFNSYGNMFVGAFTGVLTASTNDSAFDNTANGKSQHPAVTSAAATAQNIELLLAVCAVVDQVDTWSPTEPSGFTNVGTITVGGVGSGSADYRILNVAPASYTADYGNPAWANATSRDWVAAIVGLKGILPTSALERKTLSANGTRIGGRGLQGGMYARMAA